MKIILNNKSSVVLYAGETLELTEAGTTNGEWIDKDATAANCTLLDGVPLPADWRGGWYTYNGEWALTAEGEAARAAALEAERKANVPSAVTMRQARQALILAGLDEAVEAAINAIPGVPGKLARAEWDKSQTVQRNRPLVLQMGTALGLTSAQLDQLFITASQL